MQQAGKFNIQVISTSIFVGATRAITTNRYIKDSLILDPSNNDKNIDQSIIDRYYSKDLEEFYTHPNISYYDPYSYAFLDSQMSNSLLEGIFARMNLKIDVNTLSFQDKMEKWQQIMKRYPGQGISRRTKLIDHLLTCHVINGSITQVVILGSGFDSRSQRLPFSDRVTVFDIDMPSTIELKKNIFENCSKIITPKSKSVNKYIGADLSIINLQSLLLENGFKKEEPTFWVMEGLLMYLDSQSVESLLSIVSNLSSKGSTILAQNFRFYPENSFKGKIENPQDTFKFTCSDPTKFFSIHTPLYTPICHYTYSDIGCLFGLVPKSLLVEHDDSGKDLQKDGQSWEHYDDYCWYSFFQQFHN